MSVSWTAVFLKAIAMAFVLAVVIAGITIYVVAWALGNVGLAGVNAIRQARGLEPWQRPTCLRWRWTG